MVDKELKFLAKNDEYGFVEYIDGLGNKGNRLVYSNGLSLNYGDPAEIFSAVSFGKEFNPFIQSAISEGGYYKEHYNFTFGYQPADYENEEIKATDVKVYYAGVDNTISKKGFYELCLLLCNAKLKIFNSEGVSVEELLEIKSQLEEKIKAV